MKKALEYAFTDAVSVLPSYDATKISMGTLMRKNTGALATDKWVAPRPMQIGRPMEVVGGFAAIYPFVVKRNDDVDEIFLAENTAAATSRKIQMWTYTRSTNVLAYKGFINLATFCATAATIRGLRVFRYTYSTGTVDVSGTSVTGNGTAWQTARFAPARIGFGSTNPDAITTWYDMASITSDTVATLVSAAPTVTGVPFVIEEYRVAIAVTAATTLSNGGLFLVKGLHPDLFLNSGTTISLAAATDNLRATYWLADAATVLMTVSAGIADGGITDNTSHTLYALNADATTTARFYAFNIRASLTGLASGKSTSAFLYRTGTQATTGTISQANNGCICTAAHGDGNGINSYYFATTTRVYRAAVADITNGSTTFLAGGTMTEVPAGGAATFAASAVMSSVEYSSILEMFFVFTTGATSSRWYVTKFRTDGSQMDYIIGIETKQLDQSTSAADAPPVLGMNILPMVGQIMDGMLFIARVSTVAATNQIYTLPIAAHWGKAALTGQRIITPELDTADAIKYYRLTIVHADSIGGAELGYPAEPYRVYYRTSGISDNSGAWTLINDVGDLSAVAGAASIQFMFEFKVIGQSCLTTKIYSIALIYEDASTDSHYEGSVAKSDLNTNRFAYRQKAAWGSSLPDMRIRLYRTSDNALILDDTVGVSAFGTWEYSTDGTTWLPWSASADAVGNYIRYTASLLPSSIIVRALLTQ